MKNSVRLFMVTILVLSLLPVLAFAHTEDDPFVTDLIVGRKHVDIGDVLVWNDADNLYVKYVTSEGWGISETHVEVKTAMADIPQKNGNPIPGRFSYNNAHDSDYVVTVPLDGIPAGPGTELYIATHADVEGEGVQAIESSPSGTVLVAVVYPGGSSYFDTTVTGLGLNGTYEGWCIDTDRFIPGTQFQYTAVVISSYDPNVATLVGGLVDYPENLDLVNYILNQDYVGQPSPSGGNYTFGDVQKAIWDLLEDNLPQDVIGSLGDYSQDRVDEILADAYANGEGFVPECGEVYVLILKPISSWIQPSIIPVPVPCGDETAWGDGLDFPGRNWATYFTYEVQGSLAPRKHNVLSTVWGAIKTK